MAGDGAAGAGGVGLIPLVAEVCPRRIAGGEATSGQTRHPCRRLRTISRSIVLTASGGSQVGPAAVAVGGAVTPTGAAPALASGEPIVDRVVPGVGGDLTNDGGGEHVVERGGGVVVVVVLLAVGPPLGRGSIIARWRCRLVELGKNRAEQQQGIQAGRPNHS